MKKLFVSMVVLAALVAGCSKPAAKVEPAKAPEGAAAPAADPAAAPAGEAPK